MKQKIKEVLSAKRHYFKIFAVYLLISLVMFWQVTVNLFGYVVNGHGDVYQSMFNLWWVPFAIFTLHQSPYFTSFLYYPIGANLVTQTLSPLAGLFTWPIQWLGSAFTYNVLFFTAFALSGVFMFALADYMVKNRYAAFIAGLIYAFSPMHIAQAYGHLDWTIIEWVPLFLLFYIKTIEHRKLKYAVLAAASFVLLTFMGDIEQGIMVFCATVLFTVLYLVFERSKILNVQSIKYLGIFVAITIIACLPFLVAMLPYLSGAAFSSAQQNSGTISNMMWSNDLLSFFLPSYYNGIFNGIASSYASQIYQLSYQGVVYSINIGERVSFIGYTVLALALIGLYFDYKQNRLRHLAIWLVVGAVFAWLSLGPYLQVGGTVTGIPTLYMAYRAIPVLNIIREPGRFDMIFTLCIAVMAAFGFSHISRNKEGPAAMKMLAVVSLLILIEYNGMPLSGSFASSLITSASIPAAYSQLGQVSGNYSVLVLPALPNSSNDPAMYPGLATYYVSAMKKPIIGGYTSRVTPNESLSLTVVPLIQSASYLEQGAGLVYSSPIKENYSNLTLLWLANYNTAFVSMIRSAYNTSSQQVLYNYLYSVFGPPVYRDNSTFVFSTQQTVLQKAAQSMVAYTAGNWTPGYYLFCSNSYLQCSQDYATTWWGPSARAIVLFSPKEQSIALSFGGIAPNATSVELYLNNQPVQSVVVKQSYAVYQVNVTVPKGFSEIIFSSTSPLPYPSEPYITYGMENITFTSR